MATRKTSPKGKTHARSSAKAAPAKRAPSRSAASAPKLIFDRLFDARPDRLDFRDLRYSPPLRSLEPEHPRAEQMAAYLPAYVEAELVLDQGREGACTGFGLAAVVNYLLWIRSGAATRGEGPVKVSARMLYELARRYDEWDGEAYEGSSCRGALKGFHKHGVCRETFWPNKRRTNLQGIEWERDALRHPLGVYFRIDKRSVVELQSAIAEIGAVYVSARVHDGWQRVPEREQAPRSHDEAELPTIPEASAGSPLGGHAFALVGYNQRGFVVQNSWGRRWGSGGFAVMSYADWVQHGTDAWALGLGVPRTDALSPERIESLRWPQRKGRSLGFSIGQTRNPDNTPDDPWPIDRDYAHRPYQPWSTAKAYEHTLVTGNNGQVVLTDLSAGINGSLAAFVRGQLGRAATFLQARPNAQLMIYAHGGLNSEDESIDRIRVLAPYFEANDIYPFFLTWRTGPLETIRNLVVDRMAKVFGLDDDSRAQGFAEIAAEARDRSVEAVAAKLARPMWSDMRENARLGARAGRGLAMLAEAIDELRRSLGRATLPLHLVGHSAGSIVHGHLLGLLAARGLAVSSCSLYAPACSVGFAVEQYLKAAAPVMPIGRLHLHLLTDAQEKDDDLARLGPVTIYGKSLLYLVSRALDDQRKMPLLGFERAHDPAYFNADQWSGREMASLERWYAAFPAANLHRVPRPYVPVNKLGKTEQASHGSFDNNLDVIAQTIERIRGGAPVQPIEWLDY